MEIFWDTVYTIGAVRAQVLPNLEYIDNIIKIICVVKH